MLGMAVGPRRSRPAPPPFAPVGRAGGGGAEPDQGGGRTRPLPPGTGGIDPAPPRPRVATSRRQGAPGSPPRRRRSTRPLFTLRQACRTASSLQPVAGPVSPVRWASRRMQEVRRLSSPQRLAQSGSPVVTATPPRRHPAASRAGAPPSPGTKVAGGRVARRLGKNRDRQLNTTGYLVAVEAERRVVRLLRRAQETGKTRQLQFATPRRPRRDRQGQPYRPRQRYRQGHLNRRRPPPPAPRRHPTRRLRPAHRPRRPRSPPSPCGICASERPPFVGPRPGTLPLRAGRGKPPARGRLRRPVGVPKPPAPAPHRRLPAGRQPRLAPQDRRGPCNLRGVLLHTRHRTRRPRPPRLERRSLRAHSSVGRAADS